MASANGHGGTLGSLNWTFNQDFRSTSSLEHKTYQYLSDRRILPQSTFPSSGLGNQSIS
jgi:hypothetical protein